MSASIFVRFTTPGMHCWPAATGRRAYLAQAHRHLFHVEVRLPAPVNDARAIEFHDLRDHALLLLGGPDFGSASCETIAHDLARQLQERYGALFVEVTVSEDGECGATVMV